MSNHLADHGKAQVPLTLGLLSNGRPATHTISGDMLAGLLGVHNTSSLNLDAIEVKGSHSSFNGNLAVSIKQLDPAGGAPHPVPNTERHIFSQQVGDQTSLIAAHAIVSTGAHNSGLKHVFKEEYPHDGPQYTDAKNDAAMALKKGDWDQHYGATTESLLNPAAGGVITAEMNGERRTAISLNPDYREGSALCALAQKHQNNPEVLQTIFAGSSGKPVDLVNPKTGMTEPHIACDFGGAHNAAEKMSVNLKYPFAHAGLEIKAHVVDGVPEAGDSANLHLLLHRTPLTIAGQEDGGHVTKHDADNAAGKDVAAPIKPLTATDAEKHFTEGLFKAPIGKSGNNPAAVLVPAAAAPAADVGGGDDAAENA